MSKRRVSGLLDDALLEQEADSDAAETRISDSILMERLASFKEWQWFNKDDSICAPVCASLGWTCTGINQLTCRKCNATFTHSTTASTDNNNDDKPKHAQTCSFNKTNSFPLSAYAFPACTPSIHVQAARVRFNRLSSLSTPIRVARAQPTSESALNAANSIETGRVILALHGWEPLDTSLKCHLCTRVVRTLKYTSTDTDSEPAAFDPVLEHRWYCPWIHTFESGRETGVEVVRDALERVYEVDSEDAEFLGLVRRRWESGTSDGAVTPARPRKKMASSPAVGKEPGSGLKEGSIDMKSVQAARASLKSLFQDLE
ncbi:hypothetical protein BJ741DRAFT_588729 [Chytriomyces cf. hyalinus JEL632]|nr:hypothetical protein BJ741DRAFT_588729 [Chytriomyces cf. hyalinus JEL632]